MQSTPEQILQIAKKHKNSYSVVAQPFSLNGKEYQVYNITMRSAQQQLDYLNFRRGLAYIDEIIDHKHENFAIAKKGLRKFNDLMPQYLDLKNSHFNKNKHHLNLKNLFLNLLTSSKSDLIKIYDTQKLNGQNIQISYVYQQYWIIGTKNKTLMLKNQQDIQNIKYKHEHNMTIKIAKKFFKYLEKLTQQQIEEIKTILERNTLIGEFLNPQTSQHIVSYDKVDIVFFALVNKQDRINSCLPIKEVLKFCQKYGFKHAKYNQIVIKNQEQLILTKLQELIVKIQQSPLQEKGQGSVLYIQEYYQKQDKSQNITIAKVKTLQYRIYRKLREKLKMYIQKAKKGHQKMMKKYIQEVKQLVRQFNTPHPLQYYFQIAQKAFILCQDQTKAIMRYVCIEFVNFLSLCKNKDINKAKFLDIVLKKKIEQGDVQESNQMKQQQNLPKNQSQNQIKQIKKVQQKKQIKNGKKRVIVFVPMSIPATGKTSLFKMIKQNHTQYPIHIVSSDTVRNQVMQQKMKKNKSMSKKQAFEKSRKQANQRFYDEISKVYKTILKSEQNQHIFLIDKNHPQNALKGGIAEYRDRAKKCANLEVKIICLLPYCPQNKYLEKKSKYYYPFSAQYILTCLKRASKRQQHQTLQGSLQQRLNIVIGFANMFRNFHLTSYNLSKHFDYLARFKFHSEQVQQKKITEIAQQLLIKILMGSKIGSFDQHSQLPNLIQLIQKQWNQQKIDFKQSAQNAFKQIQNIFNNFETLSVEQVALQRKE